MPRETARSAGLGAGWAAFWLALADIHVGMYKYREHLSPDGFLRAAPLYSPTGAIAAVLPRVSTRHVPLVYFQF